MIKIEEPISQFLQKENDTGVIGQPSKPVP